MAGGKRKDDAGDEKPPAKKRAPAKPKHPTEPFVDEIGWNNEPPFLCYKSFGSWEPGTKIAGIDFDGTLCHIKSFAKYPRDEHDFKPYNKKAGKKLAELVEEGYTLVIFSNQGGIKGALNGKQAEKVKKRVQNVLATLYKQAHPKAAEEAGEGFPVMVLLATGDDENRKPGVGMWEFWCSKLNGGVQPDKSQSFYCGDAAGRASDFAASDKGFASAVGIEFKTPEDLFGPSDAKVEVGAMAARGQGGEGEAAGPVECKEHNKGLLAVFQGLADLFKDEVFKRSAYLRSGKIIAAFPDDIKSEAQLKGVKGIGKGSLSIIKEWVSTGKCAELEQAGKAPAAEAAKTSAKAEEALKFI